MAAEEAGAGVLVKGVEVGAGVEAGVPKLLDVAGF